MPPGTIRIGQGFDLHRLEPGRPFVMGGIRLEWPKGPVGHSDGDVLLHAIIDALLGASGLGDIGEWFPPSEEKLQGVNSADLLKQVLMQLERESWRVVNLDTTVLLEAPNLSAYKRTIRHHLASLMGIAPERIGVKAKTMEQLGPIGQEEAVAAMASLLLERTASE